MFSREKSEMKRVPMMPVRDMVIFPQMMQPFIVGREASVRALEEALAGEKKIFLATQHDASIDDPKPEEIFTVGTLANIVQSVKLPDGNIRVLVEGVERAKIVQLTSEEGFYRATLKILPGRAEPSPQIDQAVRRVNGLFEQYVKLSQSLNYDTMIAAARVEDPAKLSDTIAANLQIPVEEKQELLENFDVLDRLNRLTEVLESEIEKLNVDRNINTRVKRQMERAQKEYYLNEKLKAIHKELGRGEKNELDDLKKKIDAAGMPKDVQEKAMQELKRLEMMPPMSAESTVSRSYLDWLLAVPWKKKSKEIRDIGVAEKILEEDHYGLEKVKERILEYLAVRQLVKNPKGSILCFVGPPGVGKTSLAMSIGRATGRKFVRVSLGGVRDEAEIRGHRRTYIGALPGQIVQMMRKAGTINPVFVLDEVDKMSTDFRGDPSAALMEVLDPEQNCTFDDHYLDCDYDLSKVMFITTANTLERIPRPLQDRMEIIRIPGYTETEKLNIAKRYLVRKQREANGLKEENIEFSDQSILQIIRLYTREAGVRNLEREIASICRKVAVEVVKTDRNAHVRVSASSLAKQLGPPRFRYGMAETEPQIGVATGLAWTEMGGELLGVEVTIVPGRGKLTVTGQLGEVMQESAHAALSYIRSRADTLGLAPNFYQKIDIHIHIPEGATPKDGPSAGITLATALVSALCRVQIRNDMAMTGEITLRGRVLPIGGLKEKVLAAHRGGIKTVLIPKENAKDVDEIAAQILKNVTLIQVEHMDEVLRHALVLSDPEAFFKVKPAAIDYGAVAESKEELVDDEAEEDDSTIPSPTNLS